eukprot:TRINITY_DN10159_c0_g1_i1.p1 TRINITY_DN10159_c0_g1~~TRINITY_DN10159_c0_g1_i1.p1  ORF type:complete len:203 (+),score=37.31 TRINITY_DN10159_c0_g1_i1:35-610(+)
MVPGAGMHQVQIDPSELLSRGVMLPQAAHEQMLMGECATPLQQGYVQQPHAATPVEYGRPGPGMCHTPRGAYCVPANIPDYCAAGMSDSFSDISPRSDGMPQCNVPLQMPQQQQMCLPQGYSTPPHDRQQQFPQQQYHRQQHAQHPQQQHQQHLGPRPPAMHHQPRQSPPRHWAQLCTSTRAQDLAYIEHR